MGAGCVDELADTAEGDVAGVVGGGALAEPEDFGRAFGLDDAVVQAGAAVVDDLGDVAGALDSAAGKSGGDAGDAAFTTRALAGHNLLPLPNSEVAPPRSGQKILGAKAGDVQRKRRQEVSRMVTKNFGNAADNLKFSSKIKP